MGREKKACADATYSFTENDILGIQGRGESSRVAAVVSQAT